jgi:hypothetical protein
MFPWVRHSHTFTSDRQASLPRDALRPFGVPIDDE